jgi:hypothetical protein
LVDGFSIYLAFLITRGAVDRANLDGGLGVSLGDSLAIGWEQLPRPDSVRQV